MTSSGDGGRLSFLKSGVEVARHRISLRLPSGLGNYLPP
uniref:Uncharacterized protein n=1 Tax=Anguilla anguilla TaxID=7936 RepID=A0A0E9UMA4_ANGAN